MPPGKLVGMGLTSGGVVADPGGGVTAGELLLLLRGDRLRDRLLLLAEPGLW